MYGNIILNGVYEIERETDTLHDTHSLLMFFFSHIIFRA